MSDSKPRFNLQSLLQMIALILTLLGIFGTALYHAGMFHQEHVEIQRRLNSIEQKLK